MADVDGNKTFCQILINPTVEDSFEQASMVNDTREEKIEGEEEEKEQLRVTSTGTPAENEEEEQEKDKKKKK
jgi:hypothetical protein